jgi:hypothetical protein
VLSVRRDMSAPRYLALMSRSRRMRAAAQADRYAPVATSTRILLGGLYLAVLSWAALYSSHHNIDPFVFDHGPVLRWRLGAFTFLLLASLLVSLAALIVTRYRILTLIAASINTFYTLGGVSLFVWLFGYAYFHRFTYRIEPMDAFAAFFLILVPGVAATTFFGVCRRGAPSKRLERP